MINKVDFMLLYIEVFTAVFTGILVERVERNLWVLRGPTGVVMGVVPVIVGVIGGLTGSIGVTGYWGP